MSTRRHAISLYKQLLREAEKLNSYNFRMYAQRKIRDSFRTNQHVNDFDERDRHLKIAEENLELIRRQAIIGHLYSADKLVIEQPKKALRYTDD